MGFRQTTRTLMFLAHAISIVYGSEKPTLYYSDGTHQQPENSLYVICKMNGCNGSNTNCPDNYEQHQDVYGRGGPNQWFGFDLVEGKWNHREERDWRMFTNLGARPLGSISSDGEQDPKPIAASAQYDELLAKLKAEIAKRSGRRLTGAEILALRKPSKPLVVL